MLLRANKDTLYALEGRGFTLWDLKRSLLAACGGYITPAYLEVWSLEIWEILEAIEIVCELNDPKDPKEVDLWDVLAKGD